MSLESEDRNTSTSVLPNEIQMKYISLCKEQVEKGCKKIFFNPNDTPPSASVEEYYRKPVFVIDLDTKLIENCSTCKRSFKSNGWMSTYRHIHGLKSSYYLLQKRYVNLKSN